MNARDRVLSILERRPVDRVPVDLWYTSEIAAALLDYCHATDEPAMWRKLGLDKIAWVFMNYRSDVGVFGAQVGAQAGGQRTAWGVPLQEIQAGPARYDEFAGAPLRGYGDVADLDRYLFWPSAEHFDYAEARQAASRLAPDFAVIGPWVSLFEIYCQMRGLEQSMIDLADAPAYVDAVLDRVESIQTQMMTRAFREAGSHFSLVFVSDDIGAQTGMLMSPQSWRRHLKPRLARWCRLLHEHNLCVFYHSDGAFDPVISELINCGIDVLNPIQHVCPGMDLNTLTRRFGKRLIFHGGVDNQFALPRGSPQDVQRETRQCLDALGAGRDGYICCSCHNVQAGTPLENILTMIRTVQQS